MTCTNETYEGHPGKFESSGELGEKLHDMSMAGCDEELGSVQDFWLVR